ncbi:MAG: C40 family peptidase [Gemmatimonadaceae bacterium]
MPHSSRSRHAAALAVGAATLGVAAARPLAAQRYAVTPFVAVNSTLPGPSTLYGISFATYPGVLGVRVSGAAAPISPSSSPPDGGTTTRLGSWTADVDGVLSLAAVPGLSAVLGGFLPAGFVGMGLEGGRESADAPLTTGPAVTYGASVARELAGGVGLETEARYRAPVSLDASAPPAALKRGWEYRLGLTIRFGRRGSGAFDSARPLPRWPSAPAPRAPGGGGSAGGARGSASATRVLTTADRYVGTPYKYGGTTPGGFDCSGFVQYVFRAQGVTLPRTSRQQAGAGDRVSADVRSLRPGDLMLFDASGSDGTIDHVAIYAGDHRMIHASSSGGGVRYDDLTTRRGEWFVARMVTARRVVADGRSLVNDLDATFRAAQPLDPPDRAPKP